MVYKEKATATFYQKRSALVGKIGNLNGVYFCLMQCKWKCHQKQSQVDSNIIYNKHKIIANKTK